ncbi:TonB family protein [Mucilaginibacter sp. 14171R-50]|uniref:M56 family metallopeptidase n=1 Tax=Mucilaginibacter sp. 14171R-50 TaxID=2703789 RepID=UPI00138DA9C2|nr:M56 family metallopeptidase [Mucilaginibacter sp. 14171R-50]QHS55425.1 TonB family protein [Mucilaginibacter sp. 14171R-50]
MNWWHYLLLVNIYLTLFFGFYSLMLRRETFFQLNRIYLVGTAILSFFIPLIQSDWVKSLFITQQVQYTIYGSNAITITDIAPIKDNPVTVGQVLLVLYTLGVIALAVKLAVQLIILRRIIKDPAPSASYSFFNKIKVNEGISGKDVIQNHEMVHARQFHSADVLIIEAVMIINWFNPVVYLYRFAIKHVHEYIADMHTLKAGTSKTDYALLLLSQTFDTTTHSLVTPFFNHSLLKKRIMMLQKNRSQRIKLIKYGLSAPLFILMLILSSATISNSKAVETIHDKAAEVFASPAKAVLADTTYKTTIITFDPKTDKLPADTIPKENKTQVFTAVEHSPGFPGGQAAFSRFLSKNLKYPAEARKNKVEGRVVVNFVVETDGSLSDIRVLRGVGSGTDEEAVRVLKTSPKWKPGVQNGRKVRVQYTVPITFSLGNKLTSTGEPASSEGSPVFTAVEQSPVFPGGDKAFSEWLGKNVKYPKPARDANIQGRVIVTFVVEKDGSLSGIRVIRGVSPDIDKEALRVMNLSPAWRPGLQNGHTVRVAYSLPINFSLAVDDEKETKTGYVPYAAPDNALDTNQVTPLIKVRNGYGTVPLYVLNGKIIKQEEMSVLPANEIESITVLKDRSAISLYGKNGENGVILITTKKKKINIK